jgi:hypothetical protein
MLRNFSLYKISNIDTNNTCLDAINASLNDFSLGTSNKPGIEKLNSRFTLKSPLSQPKYRCIKK